MTRLAQRLAMLPYRRFAGRTVQGYLIESCVGIGGSGVVFKAADPRGKPVAMKLLRPLRATYDLDKVWREVEPLCRMQNIALSNPDGLSPTFEGCGSHRLASAPCSLPDSCVGSFVSPSRVSNNASASASLAVPEWLGIVREGRAYFVVLSWMPGDTLESWLFEKRHRFERAELVEIAAQLLEVLMALHERGLAQADVRPANILYDGKRISLVDFGLSGGSEDFVLDVAGFADIVIYLLYSTFERDNFSYAEASAPDLPARGRAAGVFNPCARSRPRATWRDELPLEEPQRTLLSQLIECPQATTLQEVRAAFLEAFSPEN